MPRSGVVFAVSLAIAAALPCAAGAESPPPVPAVVVKTMTATVTVEPDGSYTAIGHVEKLATNESAARTIAQYTLEYSESMDTVEILEAYTRKVDGRVLRVDPTQIFAQAPPGAPHVPMFNDHKQKTVVFPDVAGDDTVVYTVKRTYQPRFAGQFFANGVFARSFAVEDFRVSITLPKAMVAHAEARGVDHHVEDAEEAVTHVFTYQNPRPQVAELVALSPWDTDPQYMVSTFADHAAVATAYRAGAAEKAAVTPRVQALADQITAGISDRREKAHRIYDWVSAHIRYVAVFLGNGGYVPHGAASILENGYGDCKDHVVLLEALLKAKGIASVPVLINTGNRYRLPEVATPGLFNHAMTYLPEFDLYADSTVGFAPFGVLPAAQHGKPVALAGETGAGIKMLPVLTGEQNEETLSTVVQLLPDGTVSGHSRTTSSGPFSIALRGAAAAIEAKGREQSAAERLRVLGWGGKGSFQFDGPRDRLVPDYAVEGSFVLEERREIVEGKASFPPPVGLRLLARPGEFLLGSWNLNKAEPTPCFSGHQVEELSVTLPPGRGIRLLPRGKTVENAYLRYQSAWKVDGQTVSVRRELTVKLPVAVCQGEIRVKLAEAIAEIRGDYRSVIALKPPVE
jgi:transglutaminase-like putative cysteine protease